MPFVRYTIIKLGKWEEYQESKGEDGDIIITGQSAAPVKWIEYSDYLNKVSLVIPLAAHFSSYPLDTGHKLNAH